MYLQLLIETRFALPGCLLAGVFIVATGYTQQPRTSVIFLILGVGFSGLNAIGYAVNHLDIAPPFAGILMGLTNTFASTPGFISPQITGFVTSHKVSFIPFIFVSAVVSKAKLEHFLLRPF